MISTYLTAIGLLIAFCAVVYALTVGFLLMVGRAIRSFDQRAAEAAARQDGEALRRG